mmetsp:Transcript_171980/g.551247  ORF Transcript_171980/g.551247 Transcript_171980/m.551247 type:complete len:301 (+) Transcript_171980:2-904(+)
MYQNLARALPDGHALKAASVHFVMIPAFNPEVMDLEIAVAVRRMQAVIELGRTCRDRRKVGLKTPLRALVVMNSSQDFVKDVRLLQEYIQEELNVLSVAYRTDTNNVALSAVLNFKLLGQQLGKDMKRVKQAADELSQDELAEFGRSGSISLCGHHITSEAMTVARRVESLNDPNLETFGDAETMVIMDFTPDEELAQMALAREVANRIQRLRKRVGLLPEDDVQIWASVIPGLKGTGALGQMLETRRDDISRSIRRELRIGAVEQAGGMEVLGQEEFSPGVDDGERILLTICRRSGKDD